MTAIGTIIPNGNSQNTKSQSFLNRFWNSPLKQSQTNSQNKQQVSSSKSNTVEKTEDTYLLSSLQDINGIVKEQGNSAMKELYGEHLPSFLESFDTLLIKRNEQEDPALQHHISSKDKQALDSLITKFEFQADYESHTSKLFIDYENQALKLLNDAKNSASHINQKNASAVVELLNQEITGRRTIENNEVNTMRVAKQQEESLRSITGFAQSTKSELWFKVATAFSNFLEFFR